MGIHVSDFFKSQRRTPQTQLSIYCKAMGNEKQMPPVYHTLLNHPPTVHFDDYANLSKLDIYLDFDQMIHMGMIPMNQEVEQPPPIPDAERLLKQLADEPWMTMGIYADTLEDAGDPLAYGWRNIIEFKSYPDGNNNDYVQWNWNPARENNSYRYGADRVPNKVWEHDLISEALKVDHTQITLVHHSSPNYTTLRSPKFFKTVLEAWTALAQAWTETDKGTSD